MNRQIKTGLTEKYRAAKKRVILLDYDGTLVDYTPVPETTRLSEHLFDILSRLAGNQGTDVYIITGRGHHDIDKIMDHLPSDIIIIAEHGAMIKEKGKWISRVNETTLWKTEVISLLDRITSSCTGSFIEEKPYSLTWHYRNSETGSGIVHARELIAQLKRITDEFNLKILDGNKVVEILTKEVGKGVSVKRLFEQNSYDFILALGDDVTDEEMFEYFLHIPDAFTIKVGNGATFAKYKLPGISDVISLLKHLSS